MVADRCRRIATVVFQPCQPRLPGCWRARPASCGGTVRTTSWATEARGALGWVARWYYALGHALVREAGGWVRKRPALVYLARVQVQRTVARVRPGALGAAGRYAIHAVWRGRGAWRNVADLPREVPSSTHPGLLGAGWFGTRRTRGSSVKSLAHFCAAAMGIGADDRPADQSTVAVLMLPNLYLLPLKSTSHARSCC